MIDRPPCPPRGLARRTLLGLVGAGALAAATGCARGSYTRPAPGNVLTLNNDVATWSEAYDAASAVLERRTGSRLAVRAVPNQSTYQQIVRMSAQTDATTDLFKWWNGYRLQDIARGGIVTDLSAVWDQAEAEGWVNPSMRGSFSFDGRAWALPLYKTYYPVFFSRRTFADAGVAVPTTFAEFVDVAATLRDAGVTPIGAPGATTWESIIWFTQLLIGHSPDFYEDVTAGRASYLDDTATAAMELWSRMYADGFFSEPDVDASDFPGRFAEGTLGMALAGTFNVNSYTEAGLGPADVGMFLLPPVDPGAEQAVVVESAALCVSANAHKHDQAMAVADAWLATDVQQAWVDRLGDASANPAALPTGSLVTDLARDVERVRPREVTRYWEASPPVLVEGNVQDLSAFMVTPTVDNGIAVLRNMQDRADAEWKAWRA
ncbi:ABC transporter substrate-binding protein [Pseudonocardia zijingensis]|uniref:Extracellular solute-binding protein n=1 Tax=Pseudonocardia zijingensis TaxID=153376 RepID=A0ABP3ZPX1_9PSEU